MTDHDAFLAAAREQLRRTRSLSDTTCAVFELLATPVQVAFARAVAFAGCAAARVPAGYEDLEVTDDERVHAAELMLLKLSVDTDNPLWSSHAMERMIDAVVRTPGGTISNMLRGLANVLGKYDVPLTDTVANFVKDLVILAFTRHRSSYELSDLTWLVDEVLKRPTPAVAYLGLLAMPDEHIPATRDAILAVLEESRFAGEAAALLADDEPG